MMKKSDLTIVKNERRAGDFYLMELTNCSKIACGQFLELYLPSLSLRRPFSVCNYEEGRVTLLYKVVGEGTELMTELKAGTVINALTGLGNGFSVEKAERPLLIGGGVGIAPLLYLAKELCKRGKRPTIVLGFRNAEEMVLIEEFSSLGDLIITTDDGSFGIKGNVLAALSGIAFDYYYACGPTVMLRGVTAFSTKGEISMEARMGCGFGACMGCSIMTTEGAKRVCREGPVFSAAEVIFDA